MEAKVRQNCHKKYTYQHEGNLNRRSCRRHPMFNAVEVSINTLFKMLQS